jgi:hypothetical protein
MQSPGHGFDSFRVLALETKVTELEGIRLERSREQNNGQRGRDLSLFLTENLGSSMENLARDITLLPSYL